ncbi:hypothetical protein, partial [Streptomyces sp. NPDC001774]
TQVAQRTLHFDRHGAGSDVTRRCPDKEIHGRFELDMGNRLDLGPGVTIPSQRADEARSSAAGGTTGQR